MMGINGAVRITFHNGCSEGKGLDNAVGRDGVFDLMWDYENRDLREFTVFYMSCMSAMYKQQSGVSFA